MAPRCDGGLLHASRACATVRVHLIIIAIKIRIKNEFGNPSAAEPLSSVVQTDFREVLLNKFHFDNSTTCTNKICALSYWPITSWLTPNSLVQLPLCKADWGTISATNRGYRSGGLPGDNEEWKKAVFTNCVTNCTTTAN